MTSKHTTVVPEQRCDRTLPPLANGDHLTRHEFEQRYAAMPPDVRAELIEGVVCMTSPVRVAHARPHARILAWLSAYWEATPGVDMLVDTTVRLDSENEVQPDVLLRLESVAGGQSDVTDDGYIAGPPELIVEIAASSAAYDLHEKLKVYRRNGVQEYLVWQVYDNQITWFVLETGVYVPLCPNDKGVLSSRVMPGLWLAVDALLHAERGTVAAVLRHGIATPEHTAFVERLQRTENL